MKRLFLVLVGVFLLVGCKPVTSVVETTDHTSTVRALFEITEATFQINASGLTFDDIMSNVIATDLESLDFNAEKGTEKIQFILNYQDEMFESKAKVIASLKYQEDWSIVDLECEAIGFRPKKMISMASSEEISDWISRSGLYLDNGTLSHNFNGEAITSIKPSGQFYSLDLESLLEEVEISVGMNVIDAETVALAIYEATADGWRLKDISADQDRTVFIQKRNLTGRWAGPFRLNGQTYFNVCVVSEFDPVKFVYPVRSLIYDVQLSNQYTHFNISYTAEWTFDLEHDQLVFKAVKMENDYNAEMVGMQEYVMTFDEDMNLYAKETNWQNESAHKIVFKQDYDTLALWKNKKVLREVEAARFDWAPIPVINN